MCLTEEDSGMLMSSVFIVFTCLGGKGRKKGQGGLCKGTKNGAVDSEHGASKGSGMQLHTKSHLPSKIVIPQVQMNHVRLFLAQWTVQLQTYSSI
jgi:hypothetical protein